MIVQGELGRQTLQAGPVAVDDVQLQVAVALGDEGDALAVGRKRRVVVEGRMVGQSAGLPGLDVGEVQVPAAGGERREGDRSCWGPSGQGAGWLRRIERSRNQRQ